MQPGVLLVVPLVCGRVIEVILFTIWLWCCAWNILHEYCNLFILFDSLYLSENNDEISGINLPNSEISGSIISFWESGVLEDLLSCLCSVEYFTKYYL